MTYKTKLVSAMTSGAFLGLLFMAIQVCGEPRYDLHNDLVAYSAIEYMGMFSEARVNDDGVVSEIIIDDKVYQADKDIILRNRYGTLVGITSFEQGDMVAFFAVDEHLVTKMWIRNEEESDTGSDQKITPNREPEEGSDELKLIDGVWTN